MPECLYVTTNMTTESKFQPPPGCDESRGIVDQLLDDRLDPLALGRVTNDPSAGYQAELTDEPEDVVHQGGTGHDELVCSKLSRGESLQIHIGLDLGMIFLTKTMAPVQCDDLFVCNLQTGPPPFKFDFENQERLSLLVNGALRDPYDPSEGKLFLLAVFIGGAVPLRDTEDRHLLARMGSLHLPFGKGQHLPCLGVLLARVPPDDVIHIVIPGEFNPVGYDVVGRVGAQEELLLANLPNPRQRPLQKRDKRFLGVLGARQQRTLDPAILRWRGKPAWQGIRQSSGKCD